MEKINDERAREIFPYIKEKEVLDIGCYAEIEEYIKEDRKRFNDSWIHGFLSRYSKHVVGIDIEKEKIDLLKKQGYDVFCQSAEDFKFNKKFDVIFAGDVIEHLNNPGLFLEQCKKHLRKEGWLIITTPNIFCLNYKMGGIIRFLKNDLSVHPEHTFFFSPTVIKTLLQRYDFKVKEIKFVSFSEINTFKKRIQNLFCKIFGEHLKYNMMVFATLLECA